MSNEKNLPEVDCGRVANFNPTICTPMCTYESTKVVNPYPECPEPECAPCQPCVVDKPVLPPILRVDMETKEIGCKWYPEVCLPSVPPSIPCAPIHSGFCQWDGGVPKWTLSCLDGCDAKIADALELTKHTQYEWDHVLNLSSHPSITTLLEARTNGHVAPLTEMQFIALAVKLGRLAHMFDAVPEAVNENNLGLGYVKLSDGSFGLSATHKGNAVGFPLPLVSIVDSATGEITGMALPVPEAE